MRARLTASIYATAAVLAAGVTTMGAQQPAAPQSQPGASSTTPRQITVTGCVQKESDYRLAQSAGRGGVAGTGVGVANEFVLTDVTASSATPDARPTSQAPNPTGTAGAKPPAYEVTGPNEGQLASYIGKRVEITGTLKAAETVGGQPTGGATAGQPPTGVDIASKDLKLRELEVISVREATGTCPAGR
jgi:hypothetical protein